MDCERAPVSALDVPLPKVEPEDDPLCGAVSLLKEEETAPPKNVPVSNAPGTVPAVKLVNLNDLLRKPSGGSQKPPKNSSNDAESKSNPLQTLGAAYPGGEDPIMPHHAQLLNALVCTSRQPEFWDTTFSQHTVNSPTRNVTAEAEIILSDSDEELETKAEPEQKQINNGITSLEDELSELLTLNHPISVVSAAPTKPGLSNQPSQLISPIDGYSVPVEGGRSTVDTLNNLELVNNCQPVLPESSLRIGETAQNQQPVPVSTAQNIPSLLPSSEMVVLVTSEGQYLAYPSLPSPSSLSGVATPPLTSVENPGFSGDSFPVPRLIGAVKNPALDSIPNEQNAPISVRKTVTNSKSSSVTVRKKRTRKISSAPKLNGNAPESVSGDDLSTIFGEILPVSSGLSTSNEKSTWPPKWTRRKRKPKPSLPLSGSWTNPNPPFSQGTGSPQPETDPLDGPLQEIIPFSQPYSNNLKIGTFVGVGDSSPVLLSTDRRTKYSKGTQCRMFPGGCASLSETFSVSDPLELKRPPLTPILRGVGIDVQSKFILYNVYKYFQQRKAYYNLQYTVMEVTENATGVQMANLGKVIREAKQMCDASDPQSIPTFTAPEKKRRDRVKYLVSNMRIDSALRQYIHEYFLKNKKSPGREHLKNHCRVDGFYKQRMGVNFIRFTLTRLGFETVRTFRRKICIEGSPIRAWRYNYLKRMKSLVEEENNVVYTFVVKLREHKSATNWIVMDPGETVKDKCRVLTVFQAADEHGFIDGGFFINDDTVDPLKTKKERRYFDWLETHVLKSIPKGSAVVLADEKYHEMENSELKPNAGTPKKEVLRWLRSRFVGDIDEDLPKCVLLEKVSSFPVKQKYKVDSLIESCGHTPVHLPPSHRELNPVEYVWEDIRAKFYRSGSLQIAKESLADEFKATQPKLKGAWKQAQKCADTYRKNDPRLDGAQEAAIKKLGGYWHSLDNRPLPVQTSDDLEADANSSDSDTSDSDSSQSSKSATNSQSDSDSESDTDSSDDDSGSSDSATSDTDDSKDDVTHSEHSNGNKRRKVE